MVFERAIRLNFNIGGKKIPIFFGGRRNSDRFVAVKSNSNKQLTPHTIDLEIYVSLKHVR